MSEDVPMLAQDYRVNLDRLESDLTVREGDKTVRYSIELDSDRASALVQRYVFTETDRMEFVEHRTAMLTLDQLCGHAPHDVEWARSDHVVWAARGMWGIPLRFGASKAEAETDSQISLP